MCKFHITEAIVTTHNIQCTKCKIVGEIMFGDEYDVAEKFQLIGWGATDRHILCETCNEKRLNRKKKKINQI